MSFSPQQLERMLALVEAESRPAPLAPVGIAPEHFLPSDSDRPTTYLQSQQQALASPSVSEFSLPTTQAASMAEVQPTSSPQVAALPDRTPSRVEVAADPSAPPDNFAEFSGKPSNKVRLPAGAKNVQCHTIERDPDSGFISKVYTYSMESPDGT